MSPSTSPFSFIPPNRTISGEAADFFLASSASASAILAASAAAAAAAASSSAFFVSFTGSLLPLPLSAALGSFAEETGAAAGAGAA